MVRSSHCMCSKDFCNIHRKTPVLEYLFNKAADLQTCNFIKKRLQHSCFSVYIPKVLRAPISKNIWMVPKTVSSDFSKFQEMWTWIRLTNNYLGTCWVWCVSYEHLVHRNLGTRFVRKLVEWQSYRLQRHLFSSLTHCKLD